VERTHRGVGGGYLLGKRELRRNDPFYEGQFNGGPPQEFSGVQVDSTESDSMVQLPDSRHTGHIEA